MIEIYAVTTYKFKYQRYFLHKKYFERRHWYRLSLKFRKFRKFFNGNFFSKLFITAEFDQDDFGSMLDPAWFIRGNEPGNDQGLINTQRFTKICVSYQFSCEVAKLKNQDVALWFFCFTVYRCCSNAREGLGRYPGFLVGDPGCEKTNKDYFKYN